MNTHHTQFTPMATILKPGELGTVCVEHFTVSSAEEAFTRMRAAATGRMREVVPAGDYVRLRIDGQLYMTDTPTEQVENRELLRRARGDILIAGLGIGMVLPPLLANPSVTSVTVVEINPDVVSLISPQIDNPKLTVIVGDIHTWDPGDQTWDVIYFDIWANLCDDNVDQISDLHRRYNSSLRPDGWISAWGLENSNPGWV